MATRDPQERDPDVVSYGAFTGLRNDVTPERFGPTDLAAATNVNLDKSGRMARRDGYTQVKAGAAHSVWSDPQSTICLFVTGTQLMQFMPDQSAVPLVTLRAPENHVSYWIVNGKVYFSNGIDTGIIEGGVVRSWGLPVPPLPGVAVTVGDMPAGTYQFVLTYFRNDGQESGAALAGSVDVPAGSGLELTLPTSTDPTVASIGVYVTTPNGAELYLAKLVPNGTTFTTYTNDTLELDLPLNTQFMGPAPAGQLVTFYRGRMYVGVGDTIYPSNAYAYELFDLREYIQMDGRVSLLAPMEDKERGGEGQHSGFFVGTDKSCGVIIGTEPEDYQYVPKTDYGAVMGAMDYVDGSLFGDNSAGARPLPMWLTTAGLCVGMPDMDIRNLTRTRYDFSASGQGAAVFMPGPNRFIATSNF